LIRNKKSDDKIDNYGNCCFVGCHRHDNDRARGRQFLCFDIGYCRPNNASGGNYRTIYFNVDRVCRHARFQLALVIDPPTDIMALMGGYFSGYVSGTSLKFAFAGFLALAGFLMLLKTRDKAIDRNKKFGYWHRNYGGRQYVVNLWLAIPVTAAVGLAAGAVGVSGGSFKVPLMVLFCGVPMRIAVGTSSAMVAITAMMGFAGHTACGHFDPTWAVPIAFIAVLGGITGGKFAMKTRPEKLKKIFGYTTLAAAGFMVVNAICS